jgi:hypothetical protein
VGRVERQLTLAPTKAPAGRGQGCQDELIRTRTKRYGRYMEILPEPVANDYFQQPRES